MDNTRIQNPSAEKLGIILIPALIALILTFILRTITWWNVLIFITSIVAYFATVTYYCIKQKCYGQLKRIYITLILGIIVLLIINFM